MPGSTPVRVAIALAVATGIVLGYQWWTSPERRIQGILVDVASAMSHDGPETDLRALAAVAGLQQHLSPDVSIDVGAPSRPVRGRQDVISTAARLRASTPAMHVQFFDPDISVSGKDAATTRVTAQVTTRDQAGENLAAAHVVLMTLARVDGRWLVTSARLLPEGDLSR